MQIKNQLLSRSLLVVLFTLGLVAWGCDKDNSTDSTSVSTTDVRGSASRGANEEVQEFGPGAFVIMKINVAQYSREGGKLYIGAQGTVSPEPPENTGLKNNYAGIDVYVDPTPNKKQLEKRIQEAFIAKYPRAGVTDENNVLIIGL